MWMVMDKMELPANRRTEQLDATVKKIADSVRAQRNQSDPAKRMANFDGGGSKQPSKLSKPSNLG
jgi:hypothetical protein